MTPSYSVIVTPHYERLMKKLVRAHRDLATLHARVGEILAADPYNVSRRHQIKKLERVGGRRWTVPPHDGTLAFPLRHF